MSDLHKFNLLGKNKGKQQTNETKQKRINSRKDYIITDETKEKIRQSNKGKTRSIETKEKIRIAGLGKLQSNETKLKRSLSLKGNPHNLTICVCPYCNIQGVSTNMKRYHFDNCKLKDNNIIEIQNLLKNKEPIKNIVSKYNISKSTIYKITKM